MIKDWKSGLKLGVFLWILIFVEVSIVMFIPGLPELVQRIVHFIALALFVGFLVNTYFKKVKPDLREGFLLGIFLLLVGTLLDIIITIPLFVKDYTGFYSSWWLWAGYLELLVVSSLVGYWLEKK